jgi:uncharacterized protein
METTGPVEPRAGLPLRLAWYWRVLRFPLTRVLLGTIVVAAVLIPVSLGLDFVLRLAGLSEMPAVQFLIACANSTVACLTYAVFVRVIEWRWPSELGLRRVAGEYAAGAAIGSILMAAVIGILFAVGAYSVEGVNSPANLVRWAGIGLVSGIVEEIVFRCLWFRVLEEWLGTWFALIISSSFFGFAHAFNPGATVGSSVAISLEAGVLLGGAFLLSRRLWLAAGLHAGWNFTQGGVFGATVSGGKTPGLLNASLAGAEWLTGGDFGPEASVVALIVCTTAGVAMLVYAARRGSWVAPFWRRRHASAAAVSYDQGSGVDTSVLPIRDDFRHPSAPEDESQGRTDRAAENRSDEVDEL